MGTNVGMAVGHEPGSGVGVCGGSGLTVAAGVSVGVVDGQEGAGVGCVFCRYNPDDM